ncbi:MAG: GTPase HflX [Verrucomicrobiota bacterium]
MFDVREKPKMVERALLVGAYFQRDDEPAAQSLLEELKELVETLGIGVVQIECVFVRDSNKRYLMGKGKAHELMELAKELNCDCIIFDNELSPAQQRAWEEEADLTTIDRQEIILDIFNMRAQTKEARLQVELARMEYSLPRLARMWAHLDRQGGGSGGGKGGAGAARGEGEKQIEVDRRIARKRIDRIKAELEHVVKVRDTQRKERLKTPVPTASIVGYTNAGKSSLLNKLTGSEVYVEDQVFATLDPTTRKIALPDGQNLLLTDTVGFIRNLPHRLIEAFKATLEEAILADFLLHVLDASNPDIFDHFKTTMEVLAELGAEEKRILVVINKIDLLADNPTRLHELKTHFENAAFISVETGEGLDLLTHRMNEMLLDRVLKLDLRIPQSRQDLVALLHREGKILSQDYEANDVLLQTIIPTRLESKVADFIQTPASKPAPTPTPSPTQNS